MLGARGGKVAPPLLSQLFRLALGCLLALVSFIVGTSLVRRSVPPAEGGALEVKLEYFEATKDQFNALYFGSSRVLRGLDTQQVDAAMTSAGVPMRSFNFGAAGMWAFEQDYLLQRVLAMEPRHVRWIFYAGRPVGSNSSPQHGFDADPDLRSARGVQWHTPRQTRLVLEANWLTGAPTLEKWKTTGTHLELFARRMTALGRGPFTFNSHFKTDAERLARDDYLIGIHETLGNLPLEKYTKRNSADVMDEVRRNPQHFKRWIARIPEFNAVDVDLSEVHLGVFREQLEIAEERGIQFIHFTAPGYEGTPERLRVHEAGVIPTLFHFNDPVRYPELFTIESRFDRGHLNMAGAALWSARFAERLLEHIESNPVEKD